MTFPRENIDAILTALNAVGINNKYLQAGILATVAKETGIKPIRENLNYNSASRLSFVFPSKFPNEAAAIPYVNNPIALGNLVYGGIYGNSQDEGYKYRGAGFNGLTFKGNYQRYSQLSGIDLTTDPDVLNNPAVAAKVLAYFYKDMLAKTNIAKYTLDKSSDINSLDSGVRIAVAITAGLPNSTTGNIYREGLAKASIFAPDLLKIVEEQKKSAPGNILVPILFLLAGISSYLYFKNR